MTDVTIDIEAIGSVIAGIVSILVAIFGYLKTKGYIEIWRSKLAIPADVSMELTKHNGDALAKLQLSDEIIDILQTHASDDTGMIDPSKLVKVLDNYQRIHELVTMKRLMTVNEQNEVCGIVFQILGDHGTTEETGSDLKIHK